MTDLVDRLRTRYKVRCRICGHFDSDMATVHEVMDAAADRIEQLEASLTNTYRLLRERHAELAELRELKRLHDLAVNLQAEREASDD